MKSIFGILAGTALVALVSSCNLNSLPKFDDNDAFVSFDVASYTINEDIGTLNIPVTLASVAGLSATVTYSVTDGTAVYGKNYKLADESGVLVFDESNRTRYISVDITNINDDNCEEYGYSSGFTGNLTFSLSLVGGGSVNVGLENTCSVTINDLNHPLASLIGTYYCEGQEYYGWWEWNAEMYTDPDDPTIIWICGLDSYFENQGYIEDVYGTVTLDQDNNPVQITISLPYWVGSYSGYYICYTTHGGDSEIEGGTLHLDYDADTGSWVSDLLFWVDAFTVNGDLSSRAMSYDYDYPGITYTKID